MISSGEITINDITQVIPQIYILTSPYPDALALSLGGAKVKYITKDELLSITGSGNWEGNLKLDFEFSIQNTKEGPLAKIMAAMPADHLLSIPGLSWFQLREASIALETIPMGRPGVSLTRDYSHKLLCSLMIDQTKIPLEATYTGRQGLTLRIGLDAISFDGLSDMAKLVGAP